MLELLYAPFLRPVYQMLVCMFIRRARTRGVGPNGSTPRSWFSQPLLIERFWRFEIQLSRWHLTSFKLQAAQVNVFLNFLLFEISKMQNFSPGRKYWGWFVGRVDCFVSFPSSIYIISRSRLRL